MSPFTFVSARPRRLSAQYFSYVVLALALLSCADDKPLGTDMTPPERVRDLTAGPTGTTSIDLTWTAPGDDGNEGTVASIDLRFALSPTVAIAFDSATAVPDPPEPLTPGSSQTYHLAGLEEGTTYYFVVKSSDEVPNSSKMSNMASATTFVGPDTIPPASVSDLAVTDITSSSVTLRWTAPGDDGRVGIASSYDLRRAASPINDSSWEIALLVGPLPSPSTPGTREEFLVEGLNRDERIYFAIRVRDERGSASALSNVLMAITLPMPRTWLINANGSGDAPDIQTAINESHPGDKILVGPGTYFENINFMGKDIILRSEQGPEMTILDGSRQEASVVLFEGSETRAAVLDGFTITGGRGTKRSAPPISSNDPEGGGIFTLDASPIIRNNWIVRNTAGGRFGIGGGIRVGGGFSRVNVSTALIESNVFEDNYSSGNGGALALVNCRAEVVGNVFRHNECGPDGGAIWSYSIWGKATIEGNEFWENVAGDHGGGVYAGHAGDSEPSTISFNLFVRNSARGHGIGDSGSGGGIAALGLKGVIERNTIVKNIADGESVCNGGGILLFETPPSLRVQGNLIAFNHGCGVVCRTSGFSTVGTNLLWMNDKDVGEQPEPCQPEWGARSIFQDPQFCDADHDNYHVQAGSPALAGEEVLGVYEEPGCETPMQTRSMVRWRRAFR